MRYDCPPPPPTARPRPAPSRDPRQHLGGRGPGGRTLARYRHRVWPSVNVRVTCQGRCHRSCVCSSWGRLRSLGKRGAGCVGVQMRASCHPCLHFSPGRHEAPGASISAPRWALAGTASWREGDSLLDPAAPARAGGPAGGPLPRRQEPGERRAAGAAWPPARGCPQPPPLRNTQRASECGRPPRAPQQSSLCPSSLGNVLSFKTGGGGSSVSAPPPAPTPVVSSRLRGTGFPRRRLHLLPAGESPEARPTHAAGSQTRPVAR